MCIRDSNYMPSTAGLTGHRHTAPVKNSAPKGLSKIRRFLNNAENEGYSEQVAFCALASLGVEAEEDDLLLWCRDESDDADLESLNDEAINNPAISREMISEEIAPYQENEFEGSRYASLKILVDDAGKQLSFILGLIAKPFCFVAFVPFFCSARVDELRSTPCELPQSGSIVRKESGYEDEEQRISEYLTLLQLGLILRELAVKGMIRGTCNHRGGRPD